MHSQKIILNSAVFIASVSVAVLIIDTPTSEAPVTLNK